MLTRMPNLTLDLVPPWSYSKKEEEERRSSKAVLLLGNSLLLLRWESIFTHSAP